MTLFWMISAAMIVAALAILAPTLLRQHRASTDATERFNVEIAREHLAELVKQKDAGDLSDEEFAQAKQDLELALAQDLEGTAAARPTSSASGGRIALVIAALLIPLITVPTYLKIGSPNLIESSGNATGAAAGHGSSGEVPAIADLVEKLRARMDADPDNAEGWFLLGRTYMRLQNYPEAAHSFEQVVRLLPEETAALLSLADAITMRDGRRVGPRAMELLEKALQLDPTSVTAMWLLGNAAADTGDNTKALDYWQRAYPLLDDEPAMQAELGQMIAQAGGQPPAQAATLPPIMGSTGMSSAPPATDSATTDSATTDSATTDSATTDSTAIDGTAIDGARITVEVALAPAILDKASPGDTLFVLARAESGPPMPLAVARHQVSELPLTVTLTDAMAMMPAMKLSSFARVKVSAKVSKSGQAGTQAGDLVASDVVVDSANPPQSVQLLIDRVVE